MTQRIVSAVGVVTPVSADDYMQHYAAAHYEWVNGVLIAMSPISSEHDEITGFLYLLLRAYLEQKPLGKVKREPFVMKLEKTNSRREPDLQVILGENLANLKKTFMDGAADICIEVVSAESVTRDHGEKLKEYETGGVREYWIVDPLRDECRFYRLADGIYKPVKLDAEETYQTPLLPQFKLAVPVLWQKELPEFSEIGAMVQAMMKATD